MTTTDLAAQARRAQRLFRAERNAEEMLAASALMEGDLTGWQEHANAAYAAATALEHWTGVLDRIQDGGTL